MLRRKRLGTGMGVAVDVLVNSAGVLTQDDFSALPLDRQADMVDLNGQALMAMLAAFAPARLKRGHGRVLNGASIAAFRPLPTLAVDAATKA